MSRMPHLLGWMLALVLLALPVAAVLQGWIGGERWPIRHLVVSAPFKAVDEAAIRAVIIPHAQAGFFGVEPRAVRDALAALPWVAEVRVRKRWPDRLEVRLTEHRAIAEWGEGRLLSDSGVVFDAPAHRPAGLPRFVAPAGRQAEVVAFHQMARRTLMARGEVVRVVELSPRGGWHLRTDAGLDIAVGRDQPEARLGRFGRLLPVLAGQRATQVLQRADLRYTNGFALQWAAPGAGNESQG